jgi:hypothetical protein
LYLHYSNKAKPTHPDIALDELYAFAKELGDMNGAFEDRDVESFLQGVDENVVEPNVDEYLMYICVCVIANARSIVRIRVNIYVDLI